MYMSYLRRAIQKNISLLLIAAYGCACLAVIYVVLLKDQVNDPYLAWFHKDLSQYPAAQP